MRKVLLYISFLMLATTACKKNTVEKPIVVEPPVVTPPTSTEKIKDVANFKFGAAVKSDLIKGESAYNNTFKGEFNQLSAEYEMKMNFIWTAENTYFFADCDYLVNYAQQNNMDVHGHTLLWYKSFPEWFKNANYDTVTFENKVKTFIQTVVGRYKGKIKSWDVANEIFNDDGSLRVESQIQGKFKDPIAFVGRCFKYANEADPAAKLFYNDYSVVLAAGKRRAMKEMAVRFKESGVPIHGLGDQFHYRISTNQTQISNGFADLVSTGLLIHISEIDIKVNTNNVSTYVLTDADKQKQAEVYKNIVKLYNAIPANQKFAITTWGITDKYTWLKESANGFKEYPLLFDESYAKKPAYFGFLAGLK